MSAPSFAIPAALAADLKRFSLRSLGAGVIGAIVLVIGLIFTPQQFFRSYLWAYMFVLGLTLGSLALLMLQYLTGGAWGMVIRRVLEAATRTLPLVALLFIPVLAGMSTLYEWSHADVVAHDEVLQKKAAYLNVPFFIGRAVFYFIVWWVFMAALNRLSARQDSEDQPGLRDRMRNLSAPGVLVYCLTVTFAVIDWVMSLEPHWWSTIIGFLFIAGQALAAMSFALAVLFLLADRPPLAGVITKRHLHDLGKLLFAFVMFFAYLSFSQFLIIWSGNLIEEIPWYLKRLQGGWGWVALSIVFLHFALPFALLLSRDIKLATRRLLPIAVLLILMRLVDLFWWVVPAFQHDVKHIAFSGHWLDLAAPVALIGLWMAAFFRELGKRPLLPVHDPELEEALAHGRE